MAGTTTGAAAVSPEAAARPILRMVGIVKTFAGVQALRGVDLEVRAGEVHALLGENGAGKSTLMRILFGVMQPNAGRILIDDLGEVTISGPRHALSLGIGLVSQELSLVPQIEVAGNIFLGQVSGLSLLRRPRLRERAKDILAEIAPHLSPRARVSSLSMAERQVVEIARTLARGGRIIAFDEPTSSLTPSERDGLFAMIRRLKSQGKGIIYISHRMPEIHEIADRITILRDGNVVANGPPGDFSTGELNNLIAGRQLAEALQRSHEPRPVDPAKAPSLRLSNLSTAKLSGVNLTLQKGEIFGLAGLVGSGRTELIRAIFGADPILGGTVEVDGKPVSFRSPADAIEARIALIPEDRRGHALVAMMDVERNIGLASYGRLTRFGVIRGGKRRAEADRLIKDMSIRPGRAATQVRDLSGGNQQKVVIARWLARGADIFLFDEPTRGIDVGAKSEIHALLRGLAEKGASILVVSSELPELLMLADRIGIMRDGRLDRIVENDAGVTEASLVRAASGEEATP